MLHFRIRTNVFSVNENEDVMEILLYHVFDQSDLLIEQIYSTYYKLSIHRRFCAAITYSSNDAHIFHNNFACSETKF